MNYFNPVRISFDTDVVSELDSLSGEIGKRLIFCYEGFEKTGTFDRIFRDSGNDRVFSRIEENPSLKSIDAFLEQSRGHGGGIVIAIGGGSVIDTAKVVRYGLYREKYSVAELLKVSPEPVRESRIPLIAVPTTHGTGSEVTMWATVWDKDKNRKHSVSAPDNYPDHAVYDPALFNSLPLRVALSSTLDALSHSLESLWNIHSNPVSDHFAFEAVRLVIRNLEFLDDPMPAGVRRELILASMYAGLAFSNTRTAAAHSISYPLTLRYGIPHGVACSMPLFPLLRMNRSKMERKLERLFLNGGVNSIAEMEAKVKNALRGKIPFTLEGYGVRETEIEGLVGESFTPERMANNIVELSENDVRSILRDMFS